MGHFQKLIKFLYFNQKTSPKVWHNPEPPNGFDCEKDVPNVCTFFQKVGACRFGMRLTIIIIILKCLMITFCAASLDFIVVSMHKHYLTFSCSRAHPLPTSSSTIMFPAMFFCFGMEHAIHDVLDSGFFKEIIKFAIEELITCLIHCCVSHKINFPRCQPGI